MGSLISYIQFILKSQNDHGVHSPFVYNVVSNCFYNKELKLSRKDYKAIGKTRPYKETELLCRILYFFKTEKLLAFGNNVDAIKEILQEAGERKNRKVWFFTPNAPIPGSIHMGCIADNAGEKIVSYFEELLQHSSNDTLCIVERSHQSEAVEEAWESIQEHPKVTVTIDTYYFGLVFIRKEQYKQHFIIRTNKNKLLDAVLGIKNLWGLIG